MNAYPPIEKHYSKDLNITIHLKNRGPSIKDPSISWFLIMNFNFGFIYITNYGLKGYVYIVKKIKLSGPFLWMGFNCLKGRAALRRQFTFYH